MFKALKRFTVTILKWLSERVKGFPTSYPAKQWYETAYSSNYKDIWDGTPFNNDYYNRIFCYYRALTVFMRDDQSDYVDRRAGLYTYLQNEYATTDKDGYIDNATTLNRYKNTLPIDSILPMIMRRITRLYDKPPIRTFSTNPKANLEYKELYNRLQFDSVMKSGYQLVKMVGQIAIRPEISENHANLIVKTPDEYGIVFDEDNDTIIKEFWETTIINGSQAFRVWTKDTMYYIKPAKTFSGMNKIINTQVKLNEAPNYYGQIPYEILYLNGGRLDLSESQMTANKQKFQALLNQSFNASPIKMGYNFGGAKIDTSPDAINMVNHVTDELIKPTIEFFTPENQSSEINEFRLSLLQEIQRNEDIPSSIISGEMIAQSAVAQLVEKQGLIERAKEDKPALAEFERRLANLIQIIANTDTTLNLKDIDFNIDYASEQIQLEPDAEYEYAKMRVLDNTMDVIDFLKEYGGIKDADNENEIKKVIDKRKQILELINPFQENETENIEEETDVNTNIE